MKMLLSLFVILSGALAQAHCPVPIEQNGDKYCAELQWQPGDHIIKGKAQATTLMSPYLNLTGDIPQKWVYSKVLIKVWKDGDANHQPIEIPNFKAFAFMGMVDGHHHLTHAQFSYDSQLAGYLLSEFALQQMEGCWTLRYSVDGAEDYAGSLPLETIKDYTNLDSNGLAEVASYCDLCQTAQPDAHTDMDMNGMSMPH